MLKLIRFAALAVLVACAPTSGRAQEDEKVTVGTNLVTVNVSVTDSRGRTVPALDAGRFEVFADGVRQHVAHFSAGDAPFSVGVVYDMHPTTRERGAAVLASLKRFAASLRHEDDFFLLVFNERASAELEFVPTAEQIGEHLAYVPPREPNSLYDAVYLAAGRLRSRPASKKALVVISDGIDHGGRHGFAELRRRVGEFDVQLYGVHVNRRGYGSGPDADRWVVEDFTPRTGRRGLSEGADAALGQAALDEIARSTGGASYAPEAEGERELFGICSQIGLKVRRQYTLGFYPAGAAAEPRWHRLRVRVSPPSGAARVRLSYREGYRPGRVGPGV